MSERIRILLVDDHQVVRLGLRTALQAEPDLEIVGEAETAFQACVQATRLKPDLVLLDLRLPDRSGIEACREIRAVDPAVRVLILTSFGDQTAVLAAMLAGANGYLLKNAMRDDLLRAIRAVAGGQTVLDPAVTKEVLERLTAPSRSEQRRMVLSEREREVIRLIAGGLTNAEIAERLVIAEKTARNHVSNILDKLGLSRRSEAAAYAVRHGLADELRSSREAGDGC